MRLASALTTLVALTTACAGTGAGPAAVTRTPVPFGEPRPFAALYRLDCCGQRGLLATVRGDGERLSVAVAAGPAGTVVEGWLSAEGGWLRNGGERCVRPLAPGTLPLPGGAALPLDPWLAATLVSGTVPQEAAQTLAPGGWLVARTHGLTVRWRVSAGVVVAVEVPRGSSQVPLLEVVLEGHHGRVPGRLRFRAGDEAGEMRLVEWRETGPPGVPEWVAWLPCVEPQ
jgi:hypothetical protein